MKGSDIGIYHVAETIGEKLKFVRIPLKCGHTVWPAPMYKFNYTLITGYYNVNPQFKV